MRRPSRWPANRWFAGLRQWVNALLSREGAPALPHTRFSPAPSASLEYKPVSQNCTGSGTLLGTTSMDISSSGGNGTATFTNIQCSDAGTNKQITASAYGLTSAVSASFFVGGVERATGGTAIPTNTGVYTSLTGPAYYEGLHGDVGGTIGFILIALVWFYLVSLSMMAGAVINALRYELHDTGTMRVPSSG